ncbi:unnamed protein product [Caenorhabditis angaria]|uniref:Poly(A) RNA polymerase mitochondrial-like central palm domain-containing protein n=1 Tax=Caenorhabditis angaria TaxID=860376 RepID=A0A9P1N6U1_9PELO|nr:unnamed protein product [Caenorhabditis angaria]
MSNTLSDSSVLNEHIMEVYAANRENPISIQRKNHIFDEIRVDVYLALKEFLPPIGLKISRIVPFGSVACNISRTESDLDVVICIESTGFGCEDNWTRSLKNQILEHLFKNLEDYENLGHIWTAKVPILCGSKKNIKLDLSIHLGVDVPSCHISSRFLNTVTQFYPDFPILIIFIKTIFKNRINEVTKKKEFDYPNSYTLALMVIHFLVNQSYIPNLHIQYADRFDISKATWAYEMVDKSESQEWREKLRETPADVFYKFLQYYINNPVTHYIIVMKRKDLVFKERYDPEGLIIEDPFDDYNPGRSLICSKIFQDCLWNLLSNIRNHHLDPKKLRETISEEQLRGYVSTKKSL